MIQFTPAKKGVALASDQNSFGLFIDKHERDMRYDSIPMPRRNVGALLFMR